MAEALPFQLSHQGAAPLDARRVVTDTSESELTTHIQNDSTAFAGQLLWLADEGAAYVVTDAANGYWRRYDGPRVVMGTTEGALTSWITNDSTVYDGERIWLADESALYVVTDTASGDWEKLGATRVVEGTAQDNLQTTISGGTFQDGDLLWLPQEGAAYVVTDAANGYWRRVGGPRVVSATSEESLTEWITGTDMAYDGQRLWLAGEGASYVVTDAANGTWERIGGPRVVEGTTVSTLQSTISGGTYYDGQLLWLPDEGGAYVVTDASTGLWRRYDGPRRVAQGEGDLSTYISDEDTTFDGQHIWSTVEEDLYVVVDAQNGAWRKVGEPRVIPGTAEGELKTYISTDGSFYDGQTVWVPAEGVHYVVLDASAGTWRRLDAKVVVTGTTESGLSTWITGRSALHDGQVLWVADENAAYLVLDASAGLWRRLDGLEVVAGTAEDDLSSHITSTARIKNGQRVWLSQESSLYAVLDASAGTWRRIAEPTASRVVTTDQDLVIDAEDEGRMFVVDTFLGDSGYGSTRTVELPTGVEVGWSVRILLNGDMALKIQTNNVALAREGQYVHDEGREIRIVHLGGDTYRVEGSERGIDVSVASTTDITRRGYSLDGPVPQIRAAHVQDMLAWTRHGDPTDDTRAGSIEFTTQDASTTYSVASPFGMPVGLTYLPQQDVLVTCDLDGREFVVLDTSTLPGTKPSTSRTGAISSISSSTTLYPLTSDWVDDSTVVYLFEEPDTPRLLAVRIDVNGPTIANEQTATSVLGANETFARIPRRHVYDRLRDRVYLVGDAEAYAVDPSDWLSPIASVDLGSPTERDFWNGVHSLSDGLIYIFESGREDSMTPNLLGGGVAGAVAVVDPEEMERVSLITRGEIEGGDQMTYLADLGMIVGAPRIGNWEVYDPERRQSLYRAAMSGGPGAVLQFNEQLAYIGESAISYYDY